MNLEINELRLALKVSEDALLAEQQQKVKDRKLYEAKIHSKLFYVLISA